MCRLLQQAAGLDRQDVERRLQFGDGFAEFGMISGFLLEFLQNLVSTGYMLGRLGWVLLGLWVGWCWHDLCSLYILIPWPVERTLLSVAFDLAGADAEIKAHGQHRGQRAADKGVRATHTSDHRRLRRPVAARSGCSSITANWIFFSTGSMRS